MGDLLTLYGGGLSSRDQESYGGFIAKDATVSQRTQSAPTTLSPDRRESKV
jgi:hypothetical protein